MILLFLFATFLMLISYPIIGFKLLKAFRNKNKKRLYQLFGLLFLLILISGFIWKVLPGSNVIWYPIEKVQEKNYNKELTGFAFNFGKLRYKNESERAFNGDGYSIWIYEIDENTATYFKNPKEEFFSKYPNMTKYDIPPQPKMGG